jgi:hypothetical protein
LAPGNLLLQVGDGRAQQPYRRQIDDLLRAPHVLALGGEQVRLDDLVQPHQQLFVALGVE